jgi:predicted DNA-binding transcriptional regulator AlpA
MEPTANRSNSRACPTKVDEGREYLRPREAADYLGISESTLAKLRMRDRRKDGPPYAYIGKSVIYDRALLDAWLACNTVQ